MVTGINRQGRGTTLAWRAVQASDVAVGELPTTRRQGAVPPQLVLPVAMTTAQAIAVGVQHGEQKAGIVGDAKRVPVGGVGLGEIPGIPEHDDCTGLVLKFVGRLAGVIIGPNRNNQLGRAGGAALGKSWNRKHCRGQQQAQHDQESLDFNHKSRFWGSKPKDNPLRTCANPQSR